MDWLGHRLLGAWINIYFTVQCYFIVVKSQGLNDIQIIIQIPAILQAILTLLLCQFWKLQLELGTVISSEGQSVTQTLLNESTSTKSCQLFQCWGTEQCLSQDTNYLGGVTGIMISAVTGGTVSACLHFLQSKMKWCTHQNSWSSTAVTQISKRDERQRSLSGRGYNDQARKITAIVALDRKEINK